MKIVNIFLRALLLVLIFFAAMGIYVWRIEPRWVEYNYLDMPIKNLPDSLQNKTLIQLSDIHIGETVNEDFIIKKFKEVNKLNPDIVVYTGDFISVVRKNEAPFDQLEEVLKHGAKGKLATIAILGNHDYGILGEMEQEQILWLQF